MKRVENGEDRIERIMEMKKNKNEKSGMKLIDLTTLFVATLVMLICGCKYPDFAVKDEKKAQLIQQYHNEDLSRYVELLRRIAVVPKPEGSPEIWYDAVPDDSLYPFHSEAIRQVFERDYKIVYAERKYLSYYCSDYFCNGFVIPRWTFTVGTIDRRSGKIVTLDDVDEFSDREALKRRIQDAVLAKKYGEIAASQVFLTNNFYLASDGWHFVYNSGELDSFSTGEIEVVIERKGRR